MNRREALSYIVGGGLVTLAGCSSEGRDDEKTSSSSDDVGNQIATSNNLQLTLDDVFFTNRLDEVSNNSHELVTIDDGNRIILARFKIRNNGTEATELPAPSDFSIVSDSGTRYRRLELTDELSQPTSGVYYNPVSFTGVTELESGAATTGHIAFEVPKDIESPSVRIADVTQKNASEAGISWDISNSQKYTVQYKTDIQTPKEIVQHETAKVKVTVTNDGGKPGRWRSKLILSNSGGWESEITSGDGEFSTTIEGGQSATKTFTIDPIGTSFTLKGYLDNEQIFGKVVKRPIRSFGEPYTTPKGLEMTAKNPQFVQEYTVKDDTDTNTHTADSGQQFLICKITSKNTGNETVVPPVRDGVSVIIDGESYDAITSVVDRSLESPVSGPMYTHYATLELDAGETVSGWRVFEVSDSLSLSDVAIEAYAAGEHIDVVQWKN